MKAFLRRDLCPLTEQPPFVGVALEPIDWSTAVFDCDQPDELDSGDYNLVLLSPLFKYGVAFAYSIDFDYGA